MQFKLAVFAAIVSAIAVLAAPAAPPCNPASSSSAWEPTTTSSDTWPTTTSTDTWEPTSTSTDTWPTTTSTDTWEPASSSSSAAQPASTAVSGSCNAGPVSCCNTVESANNLSNGTSTLMGILGIDVSNLLNDVGVGCSSLAAGASCSASVLCCENNTYNGLINIGCVPIGVSS
ncbi:uncharacterized protein B0H18DRAFT_1118381 [Fomitopsis serialis]|uniref:uncharacterized protein n=1 Tax=Fomitopsis serialis TaxID=139415 RepID=UPI00200768E3|nr:uncharacterized protein B0H18DRAFT_1118381 [Neoantrodia serialis]KAH9927573.1 hypothetical protein B0H18DRAFT_1118381 [Neoantrodia serialis]